MRVLIVILPWIVSAISWSYDDDKDFQYIIRCHTTDFECFKRQYRYLRDNFLLGNERYGIPRYRPYTFGDETNTCVQFSGLEGSELAGIQMDNIPKEYVLVIELPFRIEQVDRNTAICNRTNNHGPLKKFVGNATIQITYPFSLKMKVDGVHLHLGDENLDVILDIPDLSQLRDGSLYERKLYAVSEWAYMVIQHVDVAEYFALPYTTQLRVLTDQIPLDRFIELYPDEGFLNLNFKWSNFPL